MRVKLGHLENARERVDIQFHRNVIVPRFQGSEQVVGSVQTDPRIRRVTEPSQHAAGVPELDVYVPIVPGHDDALA